MTRGKNGLPSTIKVVPCSRTGDFGRRARLPCCSSGLCEAGVAASSRCRAVHRRPSYSFGPLTRAATDAVHLEFVRADFDSVRVARHDQHDRVDKRLVRIDRRARRRPHHANLIGKQLRHVGQDAVPANGRAGCNRAPHDRRRRPRGVADRAIAAT